MWLILLAGILQGLLISERVLYRILLIFVVSKRSQLKKHADNQVIGSMWSAMVVYLTLPIQLVLSSVDIMLKNSTVFAAIFMFLLVTELVWVPSEASVGGILPPSEGPHASVGGVQMSICASSLVLVAAF